MISRDRVKQLVNILMFNILEDRKCDKVKKEYYKGYMQGLIDIYTIIVEDGECEDE